MKYFTFKRRPKNAGEATCFADNFTFSASSTPFIRYFLQLRLTRAVNTRHPHRQPTGNHPRINKTGARRAEFEL